MTIVIGANAVGKSTRFRTFVDALGTSYEDYQYTFFDTKKDVERTVTIGRLFPNGYLVMGEEAKNHAGWVCLDKAYLSTQDLRTDFYKWVIANDSRVKHIFAEGYFNTNSPRSRPNFLRETGFDQIDCWFMFYDTVEQFIERTESRSGSTWESKGKDPHTCAGWKDNGGFARGYATAMANDNHPSDGRRVLRMRIDAPKDFLVEQYYEQKNREIEPTQGSLWE